MTHKMLKAGPSGRESPPLELWPGKSAATPTLRLAVSRRCSTPVLTHAAWKADASLARIEVRPVGERTPERGPSSIKLVPGHPDEFIYLKSVEPGDITESWIGAAELGGNLLADEEKMGDFKCEGIEFA